MVHGDVGTGTQKLHNICLCALYECVYVSISDAQEWVGRLTDLVECWDRLEGRVGELSSWVGSADCEQPDGKGSRTDYLTCFNKSHAVCILSLEEEE